MTAQQTIKSYMDGLSEPWQRSSFVDRLDSVRSLADNEGYPEGAANAVEEFMALDAAARQKLVNALRIRNQVLDWAREADDDEAVSGLADDLLALVASEEEAEE